MTFLPRTLFSLYAGLWGAAAPFLRFNKRLQQGFGERLVPEGWPYIPSNDRLTIWIQAASGGESWLVHSLYATLIQTYARHPHLPALNLLCTTCTEQGLEVLERLLPGNPANTTPVPYCPSLSVYPRYLPFDTPKLMDDAMDLARPSVIVLLETELWPGMMHAARARNIPVLIINARMTPKSVKRYKLIRSMLKTCAPQHILAISDDDADRFATIFPHSSVDTMRNIKFDSTATTLAEAANGTLPQVALPINMEHPRIVFGSVREEEEDLIMPAIAILRKTRLEEVPLQLIIAPRHMHRVPFWKKKLRELGIKAQLRSEIEPDQPSVALDERPTVILWDTFGELQQLYGYADAAFVGGSMAPLGGQNFLEPLAAGCIPCIGPHWDNFFWIGDSLFDEELATIVPDGKQLAITLMEKLKQRLGSDVKEWNAKRIEATGDVRQRFSLWLDGQTGGSIDAVNLIIETLANRPYEYEESEDYLFDSGNPLMPGGQE